jgi:uncharacterized membrane protein
MKHKPSLAEITRRNVETISLLENASRQSRTTGEYISDRFAAFIGSWTFIISQGAILFLWMLLNVAAWMRHWDPYPFILLNLALSFQAAFAGPIIMMSQNRQSKLMDLRNELDLQVNLLAEQETTEVLRLLRCLCEKSGIAIEDKPIVDTLSQNTKPDDLLKQIKRVENGKSAHPKTADRQKQSEEKLRQKH